MNDITALMATMKAAAEKAIDANERLCVMPPDEIFDISLAHSKQLDADITLLNAHYDESTPANVKTLVEALEARDKQIAEHNFENRLLANADRDIKTLRQRIAELEDSESQLIQERDNAEEALADMYQAATGERPEWSNMFGFADAVDAVEQRLGYLESRTVTVKLPTRIENIDLRSPLEVEDMWIYRLKNALTAAGIQVIEGEE